MRCIGCGSTAISERIERTAQGYRRFRCRDCGKQFNERSESLLNRTQYPSDVIALVVLWQLRYKLSLRDLPEMFLIRGIIFSHEAVRASEAKLTPTLAEELRRRRRGKVGKSWYVDETYIKVHGHWRYLYRVIDRNGGGSINLAARNVTIPQIERRATERPPRHDGIERRGPALPLPGGDYVAITVGDTGIGMDAATLAQAVKPFFTTKSAGKGTGLGLAMAHTMVAERRRALRLKSKLGRGTMVELWLPRASAPPPE